MRTKNEYVFPSQKLVKNIGKWMTITPTPFYQVFINIYRTYYSVKYVERSDLICHKKKIAAMVAFVIFINA